MPLGSNYLGSQYLGGGYGTIIFNGSAFDLFAFM